MCVVKALWRDVLSVVCIIDIALVASNSELNSHHSTPGSSMNTAWSLLAGVSTYLSILKNPR